MELSVPKPLNQAPLLRRCIFVAPFQSDFDRKGWALALNSYMAMVNDCRHALRAIQTSRARPQLECPGFLPGWAQLLWATAGHRRGYHNGVPNLIFLQCQRPERLGVSGP
jgi:hypothetical protein